MKSLTRTVLRWLLVVALLALPAAAGAHQPAGGAQRDDRVDAWTGIDPTRWTLGQLPAGTSAEEERAREALYAAYRGDARTRQGGQARANQWFDTCEDWENAPQTPDVDLRSTFIIQTVDPGGVQDQTGFLMYACRPWATEQLGRGGITWGIDVEDEDNFDVQPAEGGEDPDDETYPTRPGAFETGPDFLVTIYPDGAGLRVAAIRTPDFEDRSTWFLTWYDDAQRLDEFEADAVVPTKAIGNAANFEFVWAVTDAEGALDFFPEEYFQPESLNDRPGTEGDGEFDNPVFPNDCTGLAAQRLVLTTEAGVADRVADDLRADGFAVSHVLEELDRVEVVDLAPGEAAQAAGRAGVIDATQTATLRPAQAEEPTPEPIVVPDDIGYPFEWWTDPIDLEEAWTTITASSGVVVAHIDAGVDGTRPDLLGRVLPGLDVRYNTALPAGSYSDRDPHGTGVAGLLAAQGDNTFEIAGVDWGALIKPYRVVDVNQCFYEVTVAEAILTATADGVRIINISLAAPLVSDVLRDAVDYAQERGILVVAAAGNLAQQGDPLMVPAAYPGVIAVGATTNDNERAAYSSTGRHLTVVAPGGSGAVDANGNAVFEENLLTLWELDRLRAVAGTSYATAIVSGAAALYFGLYPDATADDFRIGLAESARDLGQVGHDRQTGYGLLNVDDLLDVVPTGGPVLDPATGQLGRIACRLPNELTFCVSEQISDGAARQVTVARSDLFVDALAGAPLLADGPLLLVPAAGPDDAMLDEIDRVLAEDGTIYVLGGRQAIDDGAVEALASTGHQVVRLAGADRIGTALAVAAEVVALYGVPEEAVLVRADDWADAVTGGAWAADRRVPVLATWPSALHADVAQFLEQHGITSTVLMGGEGALSAAVAEAAPQPRRVAGSDRADTAVRLAAAEWREVAGFTIVNGYDQHGWAAALAGVGHAVADRAPLLLVSNAGVPPTTAEHLATACLEPESLLIMGDARQVGGSVESALVEASTCS